MSTRQYRKRPVVVTALQFNGTDESAREVLGFCAPQDAYISENGNVRIVTREGTMTASPGDWIIRGVHGEHYPCKPDIFEATYERVE